MCAALNDYIPQISSLSWLLLFFFNLQKEKKQNAERERKKRALCVIVRDLREGSGGGGVHLAT